MVRAIVVAALSVVGFLGVVAPLTWLTVTLAPDATTVRPRQVEPDRPRWLSHSRDALAAGIPETVCRDLRLRYDGETLRARYDVTLPVAHPLYEAVRAGDTRGDGYRIVNELLGDVLLDDLRSTVGPAFSYHSLTFDDPVIQPGPDPSCDPANSGVLGAIRLTARPDRSGLSDLLVGVTSTEGWPVTRDRIIVDGPGTFIQSRDNDAQIGVPDTDGRTVVDRDGGDFVELVIDRGAADSGREWFLRAASTGLPPLWPILPALATAAGYAFVAFTVVAVGRSGPVVRTVLTLLGLGVAADVIGTLTGLRLLGPAGTLHGVTVAVVVAAVVWWPVASARSVFARAAPRRLSIGWTVGAGGVTVSAVCAGLAVTDGWWRPDPLRTADLVAAGAAAAVAYALWAVAATRWFGPTAGTAVAAVSTLVAAGLAPLWTVADDPPNTVGLAVFVIAAGALVTGLCLVGARLPGVPRAGYTAIAAAVLAALLLIQLAGSAAIDPPVIADLPWYLANVATWLGYVGFFLLFACLLHTLSTVDPDRLPAGPLRLAGAAYALTVFYWYDTLFSVPVTVVAGGFLAYRWAIAPTAVADDRFVARAVALVRDGVADRRRITAHLAAPPPTSVDLLESLTHRRALDDELQSLPGSDSDLLRPDPPVGVLRARLRSGGWNHGVLAAGIGTVISLPWLVLYLHQLGRSPRPVGEYPLLQYLSDAGWVVLQWPLNAFFFGYFYPVLRGGSGFAKSLTLTALVWLPPGLYLLAVDRADLWRAWLAFGGQLLVFALVLGFLAGDLLLMRQVGLRARHLLRVHRRRFTLVWGTTLVVALAGLMAAVLTGSTEVLLDTYIGGTNTPPQPAATTR